MDYDLIVVGAGPGGLMTAYEAAKAGLQVVVIEKKERISVNRRSNTSGLFVYPGLNGEWVSLRRADGKAYIHFHRLDFSIPYTGPSVEFYDSHVMSNSGYTFHLSNKSYPLGVFFDMDSLLADLVHLGADEGVSFVTGALGTKAENTDHGARVLVKKGGTQFWLTAQKVVAADGLTSRIADSLGLNKKRFYYGRNIGLSYRMEGVECPYPPSFMMCFGSNYSPVTRQTGIVRDASAPGRYFIGAGGIAYDGSRVDNIEYLTTKSPLASWFKRARIVNALAYAVKVFSPLKDPVCGNVLLIGETVGWAETLVHGAMACGYMAGRGVAKELVGEPGFEEYCTYWNDSFQWLKGDHYQAAYMKQVIWNLWFSDDELDELFKLVDGQTFYGEMSPFAGADKMCDAILAQPGLKPDLAKKLAAYKGWSMKEIGQAIAKQKGLRLGANGG
jgi:digeranylgeranylglycerophospholipid reductase